MPFLVAIAVSAAVVWTLAVLAILGARKRELLATSWVIGLGVVFLWAVVVAWLLDVRIPR